MSAVGQWFHALQEDAERFLAMYPDEPNMALQQFLRLNPGQEHVFEACRSEWDGDGYQCPDCGYDVDGQGYTNDERGCCHTCKAD